MPFNIANGKFAKRKVNSYHLKNIQEVPMIYFSNIRMESFEFYTLGKSDFPKGIKKATVILLRGISV